AQLRRGVQFLDRIARAGIVGLALCSAGRAVAPDGGYQRVMGTNPFAWAAPGGPDQPPFVLDFATSGVAEGKLRVARSKGAMIPEGLVVDSDGHPSLDPAAFYAGGAPQTLCLHQRPGITGVD